jgi:hypothetical protein
MERLASAFVFLACFSLPPRRWGSSHPQRLIVPITPQTAPEAGTGNMGAPAGNNLIETPHSNASFRNQICAGRDLNRNQTVASFHSALRLIGCNPSKAQPLLVPSSQKCSRLTAFAVRKSTVFVASSSNRSFAGRDWHQSFTGDSRRFFLRSVSPSIIVCGCPPFESIGRGYRR